MRRDGRSLFDCSDDLLKEFDLVACVVGDCEHLIELDLRVHAIALYDAVKPRPTVERLGVLDALLGSLAVEASLSGAAGVTPACAFAGAFAKASASPSSDPAIRSIDVSSWFDDSRTREAADRCRRQAVKKRYGSKNPSPVREGTIFCAPNDPPAWPWYPGIAIDVNPFEQRQLDGNVTIRLELRTSSCGNRHGRCARDSARSCSSGIALQACRGQ
jgi:hypothetical protein